MNAEPAPTTYVAGGTVQASGGIYIERNADKVLLDACLQGLFAYLLSSRQVGKSSLIVRTTEELIKRGCRPMILDLTTIGVGTSSADQWYRSIITEVASQLKLSVDASEWWDGNDHLTVTHRFSLFFQELVKQVKERVTIFVDEIDSTLALNFTDDFFAAIRALHNSRAVMPDLRRLSFVLGGVATPAQLIQDPNRTPFNLGERIELTDFTEEEAQPLLRGIGVEPDESSAVLRTVLDWSGGHPYLTLRIFRSLQTNPVPSWTANLTERRVRELFLERQGQSDSNLQFVREMLAVRARDNLRAVLEVYRDVWRGVAVADQERDPIINWLKLSGVVKTIENHLKVRSRIYREVFNAEWVRRQLPSARAEGQTTFVVGGAVQAGRGIYLERSADAVLMHNCRTGTYCYVFAPRQMGKSSLMVHTAERLISEGFSPVLVDLTRFSQSGNIALELIFEIVGQLNLEIDVNVWAEARTQLSDGTKLAAFLEDVVLHQVRDRIIIFFDEMDVLAVSLFPAMKEFGRDFLKTIRSLYDARASKPQFERLSCVFLGSAEPADFLPDDRFSANASSSPFAIAQPVELADYTFHECAPLLKELNFPHDAATAMLKSVLSWTGGHPYLTLKLFRSLVEMPVGSFELDGRVRELFLSAAALASDPNLSLLQDFLLAPPANEKLESLSLAASSYGLYDSEYGSKAELKKIGLVKLIDGRLRVRNRIYAEAFNEQWISAERAKLPREKSRFLRTIRREIINALKDLADNPILILTVIALVVGLIVLSYLLYRK